MTHPNKLKSSIKKIKSLNNHNNNNNNNNRRRRKKE
jgi:hypothetical protein